MRLAGPLSKQLNTLEDQLESNAQRMFLAEAENTRQRARIIGEFNEMRHQIEKLRSRPEAAESSVVSPPIGEDIHDRVSLLEAENRLLMESIQVLANAMWENSQAAHYIGRLLLERDEASWSAFEGLWRRLGRSQLAEDHSNSNEG